MNYNKFINGIKTLYEIRYPNYKDKYKETSKEIKKLIDEWNESNKSNSKN